MAGGLMPFVEEGLRNAGLTTHALERKAPR
jgi:hypothetical protein